MVVNNKNNELSGRKNETIVNNSNGIVIVNADIFQRMENRNFLFNPFVINVPMYAIIDNSVNTIKTNTK